jgi:hypothetical protein
MAAAGGASPVRRGCGSTECGGSPQTVIDHQGRDLIQTTQTPTNHSHPIDPTGDDIPPC